MIDLSIIIAVLESYKVVNDQIKYMSKILPENCELIIIDDGSDPKIKDQLDDYTNTRISIYETNDTRPWSQPCARNFGATKARGNLLLFTDIDHILTKSAIIESSKFNSDKLVFKRKFAILKDNTISREEKDLIEYGLNLKDYNKISSHANTFVIKKSIFNKLKGYDKKFCGKYGGDDTDFNNRYGNLHRKGLCSRSKTAKSIIYVFPDPRKDKKKIFHSLRN